MPSTLIVPAVPTAPAAPPADGLRRLDVRRLPAVAAVLAHGPRGASH